MVLLPHTYDKNGLKEYKSFLDSDMRRITSVQAVCWTPLYVKGKTQAWPVVVLHAGDAVVAGE